jgi:hypothetical protein
MIPALHLTWDEHMIIDHRDGADRVVWGKEYGLLWFWTQMLMGDAADNIPGLPWFVEGGKKKRMGEVTARNLLRAHPGQHAEAVEYAYETYYKGDARLHMMEQGVLLWMRRNPQDTFDVANSAYGPLAGIMHDEIRRTIEGRIPCV